MGRISCTYTGDGYLGPFLLNYSKLNRKQEHKLNHLPTPAFSTRWHEILKIAH